MFGLAILTGLIFITNVSGGITTLIKGGKSQTIKKPVYILPFMIIAIVVGMMLVNFICSPMFNAKSYSKRITIKEDGNFTKDIEKVNFNTLPLLDRNVFFV